jgi:hypothetical protein
MAHSPNDNPLSWTMTDEQKAHYNTLDFNLGIAYLHELELANESRVRDSENPSVLHERTFVAEPVKQAPAQPTLTVEGHTFTGTEREIEMQLTAFFTAKAQQPAAAEVAPARNTRGQFVKQDSQPSTTSAADKIVNDQVARAIEEKTGVSLDEVKQLVEEKRGRDYSQSWAEATTAFFQTAEGKIWPGGETNQRRMAEIIKTHTLPDGTPYADAPDKTEVLRACAEYMREHELIEIPPAILEAKQRTDAEAKAKADEDALKTAIANAHSPQEIEALIGKTTREQNAIRNGGGGTWGTR